MKMSLFAILTVAVAFLIAAVYYFIEWILSPDKCPICCSIMDSRFNENENNFEYKCPNCGHEDMMEI